ncbi:hypothetical protein KP78_39160 [Jeotgalibacillus soli]|uniref:Uncharacterized protein n=1 Tax=Jeotgalibacillus soli TaxID=889306 RepID=A0A0C2VFA4_9BACL|nr:hypothetical protein KP78_39160 [Jeotgalibacillus soli]
MQRAEKHSAFFHFANKFDLFVTFIENLEIVYRFHHIFGIEYIFDI